MTLKNMTEKSLEGIKFTHNIVLETKASQKIKSENSLNNLGRTVAVLLIMVMTVMCFSFCADSAEASGGGTKQKNVQIKGKYKDVTAFVEVKMTDPDSLEVDDEDYYKFLTELEIGNGLTIPLETEDDLAKMREIATSDAVRANEKEVQWKKAQRIDKQKVKKAEAKARKLARSQYDSVWNMPSEKMKLPEDTDGSTKTYMDYKTVTAQGTPQYSLLNSKKAYTEDGFRMYDGYYCIALGSFYGNVIGTKYYIELSNGRILRCVLGDQKSDRHTDKEHQYAVKNKDIMEFIIDNKDLPGGDVSAEAGFEGSIVSIRKITGTDLLDQDFDAVTVPDSLNNDQSYQPGGYNDSGYNGPDPSTE